jgi:nucleoside-diphosphate-sugar epimerase
MRALVADAAGFIGSTLVDRMLGAGHQVTGSRQSQRRHPRRQPRVGPPTQRSGSGVVLVVAVVLGRGVRAGLPGNGAVAATAEPAVCSQVAYPGVWMRYVAVRDR